MEPDKKAADGEYECQFFYEDEVYRYLDKTGRTQFGIVLENSEYASSDEDSDVEEAETRKLKKGQIRVAWHPSGKENVLQEKKVLLADRSLMPGDVVVRKENGREKMCGYCRQVKSVASVVIIGTDQVLLNVNSEDLQPLETFSPDIAMTLDYWVGVARSVKFKILLRTKDGSLCSMDDHQVMELRQLDVKYSRNSEFHRDEFYPGQVLVGKPSHFSGATWVEGSLEKASADPAGRNKKKARIVATVQSVEVVSLGVQWQCQSWTGNGSLSRLTEQPSFNVEGEDLKRVKMLNVFEPCTLQLGDKSFYTFREADRLGIVSLNHWHRLQNASLFPQLHRGPAKKMNGSKGATSTSAEERQSDEWESDVSESEEPTDRVSDAGSTCASYRGSHGRSKSVAGGGGGGGTGLAVATRSLKRRKLRRAKTRGGDAPASSDGASSEAAPSAAMPSVDQQLVVETLCTSSWVDVVWQDGSTEMGISSRDLYPVHHLDDKEFFPGDFVIAADPGSSTPSLLDYGVVQRVDAQARTALVHWFQTSTKLDWLRPEMLESSEVSVYDLKDHPDFKYRPGSIVVRVADPCGSSSVGSAGQVLDNHVSGQVEVWWAEGATCLCWPQELYRVGDYDSEAGELWGDQGDFAGDEEDVEDEDDTAPHINEDDADDDDDDEYVDVDDDEDDDRDSRGSWESIDSDVQTTARTPKNAAKQQQLKMASQRARSAMNRLESLVQRVHEPTDASILLIAEIFKLLVEVYRECRHLDRLLGSSYFDERHFEGLLEKMRQDERAQDETVIRLPGFVRQLFVFLRQLFGGEGSISTYALFGRLMASSSFVIQDDQTVEAAPNATASTFQNQLLQVCMRLGQLLSTQLGSAQEEVNRRCGEPVPEAAGPAETAKSAETAEETTEPAETAPAADAAASGEPVGQVAGATEPTVDEADETLEESSCSMDAGPCEVGRGTFCVLETAPLGHKFYANVSQPTEPKAFQKALRHELGLLRTSLPRGIHVKTFEDRMDLFAVLIEGPAKTPYEGGLFLFDFQLPNDYPRGPPLCHYWSYCTERLNPNLYEEGKVCVSLLGTWSGKGSEMWGPGSNLLQVLVSIQGLILVAEPYYNEAGYERQRGSVQARENSRLYNEMVLLKMLQAMGRLGQNPPPLWRDEIVAFLGREAAPLIGRYRRWVRQSAAAASGGDGDAAMSGATPAAAEQEEAAPDFPLVPASRGFCLTLNKSLAAFEATVEVALRRRDPGAAQESDGGR